MMIPKAALGLAVETNSFQVFRAPVPCYERFWR